MENLIILTPEKVAVEFRLAGLGSRVGAYLIDLGVLFIVYYFLAVFAPILIFATEGLFLVVLALALFFFLFGYHALLETLWNGQTLGKKAVGIRVRMVDGSPITPFAAIGRNLLRIADLLPLTYTVGILAIFFSEKSQRFGDQIAGTIVTHETRNTAKVPLTSLHTTSEHPLEHLVGDLNKMTAEEYLTIKTLCDRYPYLPKRIQEQMLDSVWKPLALRHQVQNYADIHPVYLMEAIVMKYARKHRLL